MGYRYQFCLVAVMAATPCAYTVAEPLGNSSETRLITHRAVQLAQATSTEDEEKKRRDLEQKKEKGPATRTQPTQPPAPAPLPKSGAPLPPTQQAPSQIPPATKTPAEPTPKVSPPQPPAPALPTPKAQTTQPPAPKDPVPKGVPPAPRGAVPQLPTQETPPQAVPAPKTAPQSLPEGLPPQPTAPVIPAPKAESLPVPPSPPATKQPSVLTPSAPPPTAPKVQQTSPQEKTVQPSPKGQTERKTPSPTESGGPPPPAVSAPAAPNSKGSNVTPSMTIPGQPVPAPKTNSPGVPGASTAGSPAAGSGSPPSQPTVSTAPPHLQRAPEAPAAAPRFDQVQQGRQERVEDGGRRTVIQEQDNRVIIKQDNRIIIQHDEGDRFRRLRDAKTERRPDGVVETFYVRPDGFRVVSEIDPNGRLLRRYRRGQDGREFSIIDNRRFLRNAGIAFGVGGVGLAVALNLPPPVVRIPQERYIVDYERASDEELFETLNAPPVQRLERSYSLEEVRYNYELRQHMRRVDLDAINFEFGAYEVAPDQFAKLERLSSVILRVLQASPAEAFLIEGHTDAVGSDVDNLSLSDRRAEAVAQILTETFGVPPENLVTQGYGKQHLKIDTNAAERANRRVAVRRITPLLTER